MWSWYTTNPATSAVEEYSPWFQQLCSRYLPVCIPVLWFHILQPGLHWAIIMAPKDHVISKLAVASTTRGKIWTILETLELASVEIIIHYGSTQDSIVDNLRYKGQKKIISCKNLGRYQYWLVNGIINTLAPLQPCRCQITEILLYIHLKLV